MRTRFSEILNLFLSILLLLICGNAGALTLPDDNAIDLAAGNQQAPAICLGANTILTAWADSRANPYSLNEYETSMDIYGARLDTSGNLLDPLPITITRKQASQEKPKIAWNGSNWLVVYESYDVSGTGYYYQKSLEALRVSTTGQVLDAVPIRLFGLTPSGNSWAVASNGNNWVVVNQSTSTSGDIVAVRISAAGLVLDPPTKALVKATYYGRSNFHLAFAGGVFLLTFDDDYVNGLFTTSAVRFDSNLNLLNAQPINFLDRQLDDLVGNGTQFFAVWNQQLPDFSMAVTGSRVATTGQKLDGAGKNISGNFPNTGYNKITAVWDGMNWRVSWGNNSTVRVARFSIAGSVLDPGGVAVPGPQTGFGTGNANGGMQLIWTTFNNNNYDVRSANISSANSAAPNRNLSLGTPQQQKADIAAGNNGYMIVYRSLNANQNRVLAQPLDANGNPVTAQPIQLDTGNNTTGPGSPNVAWNGSLYLVAWGNGSGIVAQRLQPNGTKIDPAPFVVMNPGFGAADVASLGGDFLIAARKYGYTPQIIVAIGARVRGSDGMVIDSAPLVFGSNFARTPVVTTVGGRWLVAFHNNWTHDNPTADTLGTFVSTSGTVTNFHIHGPFSTAGGNSIFELGLASNGNLALVVQSQELTSGVETDLLARTIGSTGTVGPVINLTPWVGNQYRPRVAWDGNNFVVIYQDQKNRLALHTLDQLDARSDIFGMRINSTGIKIDPQGFAFSALPTSETDPTVVSQNGLSLLAASLMKHDSASYRISYAHFGIGGNKWPVAVINASATGGDVSLPVNFNSTGSTDPDGSIVSYLWNFGDGGTSTAINPSHTFTSPGAWLVTLTVTDNQGAQTQQALMIQATTPNQPPVAVASSNKESGNAPLDVIFYADGSYDPDGFVGNIEWLFSDGGTSWGSPTYYTFNSVGNYSVTLRVYDSRGATDIISIPISVTGANQAPVAVANASPTSGGIPLSVAFSSVGSNDPDGAITEYHWDFGDAVGFSNQPNPNYIYNYAGTYTATLTVFDNNNATSTATVLITVSASSVLRSTAIDLTGVLRAKKVTVTGKVTVKNKADTPVSGATVSIRWTRPGGSTLTQTATTNTSGIASFSTSGSKGTYTLTVTNIVKAGYTFDAANSILNKSITK